MHRFLIPALFLLSACGWKEIQIEDPTKVQTIGFEANEIEYSAELNDKGSVNFELLVNNKPAYDKKNNVAHKDYKAMQTSMKASGSNEFKGVFYMKSWNCNCIPPFFRSDPYYVQIKYTPTDVTEGKVIIRYK